MKKQSRKSKRKLFDPDKIAVAIHQAVERDFHQAQHEYCLNDSTVLYALNRQANELRKKYCSPTQEIDRLEDETFDKFFKVNRHMTQINKAIFTNMPYDHGRLQSSTRWSDKVHLRAQAIFRFVLGNFSVEEMFNLSKHSSGATLGVSYKDTSMEAKWTLPLTVTERTETYMTEYLSYDQGLKSAIRSYSDQNPVSDWYTVVEGSRATTVDKTTDKRRFIAVEPTGNMFFQQGLMEMMYKRLKKVGLDVETLPALHKQLALESSITGSNATIDWSSASDCVSIELLRWLCKPEWFDVIWDLRCDYTEVNGCNIPLSMISTMGNAVTFPLETLVFWSYANAVLLSEKPTSSLFPEWEDLNLVSVFGDDCIVPSNIASKFIEIMEEVGFIVNTEKTFTNENPLRFRESCGGDYLAGYDVRPFFLKAPSSNALSALEPWLYIVLNELGKKYITYFGSLSYVYDKELFRYIFGLFERYKLKIKLVPPCYPPDAGLHLQDVGRLKREYGFSLSRIRKSNHGSITFSFCNFRYWKSRKANDDIRYADWLKNPVIRIRAPFKKLPTRDKGGYVVANGYTAHWTVPAITAGGLSA